MPISDRFNKLLAALEPTNAHLLTVESHRSSVGSTLRSAYARSRVKLIGSQSRGSAVRGISDLDLMVVLRIQEIRWGTTIKFSMRVLQAVRQVLRTRFVSTSIRRDGQAVVIHFGQGNEPLDVVPAYFLHPGISNYPVLAIPDGSGNWMPTSPEIHNRYIGKADQSARGKLKYTAMLMKHWCHSRKPALPLSSFHLELLLARFGVCSGAKSYACCVADALHLLCSRKCRALNDPLKISGRVRAASTDTVGVHIGS